MSPDMYVTPGMSKAKGGSMGHPSVSFFTCESGAWRDPNHVENTKHLREDQEETKQRGNDV
jgi:hypothetical protein